MTDNHVGGRIRERRIMVGLTQQRLAEMIGVTCQQAHKYERGINRVSAGRLFEIARALSAPITYFYEGIGEEGPRQITNDINAGSPGSQKAPTRSPARPWRHSAGIDPDRRKSGSQRSRRRRETIRTLDLPIYGELAARGRARHDPRRQ